MEDLSLETPSSPRLTEARHAALALVKASGASNAPIVINDIFNIAKKRFDITVQGVDEGLIGSKVDAVTKRDGDEIYILYNDSRHVHRKRFSLAHELGHLYLGHLHGSSSIDLGSDVYDEIEANQFAAYLLMPPAMLRLDIKAGIKKISVLADKYGVSDESMWWQVDKAGLLKLL